MINKEKRFWQRTEALILFLVAILVFIISFTDVFSKANRSLADMIYQKASYNKFDKDIVIIKIDDKTISELGFPGDYSRSVYAGLIDYINSGNGAGAIGIDVTFDSLRDPEGDSLLSETVAKYDNVVLAASIVYESRVVEKAGKPYVDTKYPVAIYKPYDELYKNCSVGVINSLMDSDGFVRHAKLSYRGPKEEYWPSFAYSIAKKYNPSLDIKVDDSDIFYISYTKEPGGFSQSYSFSDVVAGTIPADAFDDKIVLVGAYAPGLLDSYFTSVDHSESMYGIDIHASVIENILDEGLRKKEIGDGLQRIILGIILLVAAVVFSFFGMAVSTVTWIIVSLGYLIFVLIQKNIIVYPLYIPLCTTILYVTAVAIRYVKEYRAKRRVVQSFGRYVDEKIMKEILKEGESALGLSGKRCEVALLFVDIRGFTSLSEKLEPEDVVNILNKYLSLVTDCIMRNGGTLDKFIGDCAMAFWNAPIKQDDYIMKAVCAAKDMVTSSKALSDEIEAKYGHSLSFGVGVHCGEAVIGNIGSEKRMDFTAIGDTVNTTSRIEGQAGANMVYLSKAVVDSLGDRIKVVELEPLKLKGKKEPFPVFGFEDIK